MAPQTLVVIAARNEAAGIGATLEALERGFPGVWVVVVDDASDDATAEIARAAGAEVIETDRHLGKGGAATRGARRALERGGEEAFYILCDADLGRSAERLAPLVGVLDAGSPIAVAAFARRVGGGFGIAVGFARWAIRRGCGVSARAPISGQRALTGPALRAVLPFAPGFGMEIGMTIDATRAGFPITEIELDLEHRATGRDLGGVLHRARQLRDFAVAYGARRR